MRTLITGGMGFIGSCLARMLIARGERPLLMDVSPIHPVLSNETDRFDFFQGSVSNLPILLTLLKDHKIERIFHLGGMLSVPSEYNPWQAFEVNAVGTYHILESARIMNVRQVVYSSTIAVYSEDIQGDTITDTTLQRPVSMYGTTKVFGELLGRFYGRKFGVDFRGLRLPSVVGPGAKTAHMSIYNAWAIEEPLKGNPYALNVAPETKCPAIYYKDAARALLMLAEADVSDIRTVVYNIAGILPHYTALELVETVRSRIPGARLTFNPDPHIMSLLSGLARLEIDESRAREEWGWTASYDLPAMVDDFIKAFSDEPMNNEGKS